MAEKWKIVNAIAGVLIFIGLAIGVNAVLWSDETTTDKTTIPAGQYLYYYTTSSMSGASVSGSFSVIPGAVDFYILNEEQFNHFQTRGIVTEQLFSDINATNGDFSVSFPGTGVHYIVIYNSAMTATYSQSFTITYTLKGLALTPLILGIVIVAIAVVMLVYGLKLRAKSAQELEEMGNTVTRVPLKKPSDVVVLEGDDSPTSADDKPDAPAYRTRVVKRPPEQPPT